MPIWKIEDLRTDKSFYDLPWGREIQVSMTSIREVAMSQDL
jgi:hypothetical protein